MRILVWNIRNRSEARTPRIVEEIAAHDPDVIALGGYREPRSPRFHVAQELRQRGWVHVETSNPAEGENGIAVLACTPLKRRRTFGARWLDLDLPGHGFGIGILQIPAAVGGIRSEATLAKRRLWDALLEAAEDRRGEPFLFAGSWNTGSHRIDEKGQTFVCNQQFEKLSAIGWCDLWRHHHPGSTEWTWYSNQGNGFRVDHAFGSPALVSRVVGCRYSHAERAAKVSPHSIVLIEID